LKRSAYLPRQRGPTILRKSTVPAALLAAVGHDLRTPLAGIKVAVSSLRQSDATLPPEAQAELLATIEESTDALSELVDNLLGLSRL
jgi:K+-sensing histidine kinase KdpD